MRLTRDIALGLYEAIRETLPGDEQEAGPFLAGMVWAFVIFWAMLIFVTLLWFKAHGATP